MHNPLQFQPRETTLPASKSGTDMPSPESGLFGIVMAAGLSARFGATKQLALFRGQPMVAHSMRVAEAVLGQRCILVAGNEWPAVTSAAGRLAGFLVINEDFRRGLGSSIAAGVAAVPDAASGVLLLLADQPLVDAASLRTLVDTWLRDPQGIVASEYGGVVGPPVIFPARCFDELRNLDGDTGARQVIRSNAALLTTVNYPDAATDIDRKEDLEKLDDRRP